MAIRASGRTATWLAAGLLLAGCAHGSSVVGTPDPPASSRTSASPSSTAAPGSASVSPRTKPRHQEIASAVGTLRRYLHAWVAEGPSRAGRFLVLGQRMTSDRGAPRISAGTVASYRLYRWSGPRRFILLVSLDLTFSTNPMAWSRGINERFVTVRRSGHRKGFVLEFATSP